jgi:biopolymer transport protein TolR
MAFGKLSMGKSEEESEDIAEINIIPLVDVMLVLLIIFMVTAPLSIGGIKVELPHSNARGGLIDEDRIVLSINSKGDFYLDKTKIADESLPDRFKEIYKNREKKELFIRADRGVAYGKVVDAMGAAKVAGVLKMGMLTQAPPTTTVK